MKKTLPLLSLVCLALAACSTSNQSRDIVKETYVHKFGVPVAKADWESQGRDGQTIGLRKDGVTVTSNYEQGVLEGDVTYTFPNSKTTQYTETYAKGALVAKKEHYASGAPLNEEQFNRSGKLVKLTRWYEDGTPQATEHYDDALLVYGEYRTPLNVVESKIVDGHGNRIRRSNEGVLLAKEGFYNGQMVERGTYFPNGEPSSIATYQNGVLHGTRLTFLNGGLPNTVEQWNHGKQTGITVAYQNGEKIAEIPYVNGVKHGTEYRFRDGNILAEEITWQNNVQHGERIYHISNKETRSEWYYQGELVSRFTFDLLTPPTNMR